ncbi:PilZ domain-containing protein [Singulisphaera sp. PoT]|uniref:PilZ domain-containing protein n=1 Tax=Singulisphaera sp. PoT TaxID=3411797 RepID=UPI003BF4B314
MSDQPKNQLLRFLRARPKAVGEAFRTNPRYASRHRGRLSWTDVLRTRTVPIRLIDISRAGAAVAAASPPPTNAPVRIRLVGESATPWIEADVLGVEPKEGLYRVRLRFREPCPTFMIKSAVLDDGTPQAKAEVQESDASA